MKLQRELSAGVSGIHVRPQSGLEEEYHSMKTYTILLGPKVFNAMYIDHKSMAISLKNFPNVHG